MNDIISINFSLFILPDVFRKQVKAAIMCMNNNIFNNVF